MGKVCTLATTQKVSLPFPPKNLRNRSIYRWEQQLPLVDFHHSTTPCSVYVPTCVVYEGLEESG